MNPRLLEDLARQRTAELHRAAAPRTLHSHRPHANPSLRVRTGWTLVDLGLRLAVPAQRRRGSGHWQQPVRPGAVRS